MSSTRHDVVIVGARAAGAATALLLARMGHDVAVVDRAAPATDTNSTHQIARTGVVALHRWGLLGEVVASGTPPIRQVTFHADGEETIRAVKDRSGVDLLLAPRRYVLDTILASAARRAGAAVDAGFAVSGVLRDDRGRSVGIIGRDHRGVTTELQARFVVGADGLSSTVARDVGAELVEEHAAVGAIRYAYFAGLAWSGIEFYVEHRSFAGVFPTHRGEACIWVCTPTSDAISTRRAAGSTEQAFARQLERAAPTLAHRLRSARRTSLVRGMLRAPNQLRRAAGPGWALVGDAGYHRDPASGHGISDAFRDAEFLATALDRALRGETDEAIALADFQHQRDQALREVFEITKAMVAYPPVPEFVELMRRLGRAIDTEAADLAARPTPSAGHRTGPTVPVESPLVPV